MAEKLHETVSALVDDEASEFELHQVLKAAAGNAEVRDLWQRCHRVQSAVHHPETAPWQGLDISSAVASALEQEQALRVSRTSSWLKPLSGLAVAASVAAVTVFSVGFWQQGGSVSGSRSEAPVVATAAQNGALSNNPVRAVSSDYSLPAAYGSRKVQLQADAVQLQQQLLERRKLEAYLLRHTEQATMANHQGMMPLARVASYDIQ